MQGQNHIKFIFAKFSGFLLLLNSYSRLISVCCESPPFGHTVDGLPALHVNYPNVISAGNFGKPRRGVP